MVYFNWLMRSFGISTLSSIQKIGNTTLGTLFTNSTLGIVLRSMLNCTRLAADRGVPVICQCFQFTRAKRICDIYLVVVSCWANSFKTRFSLQFRNSWKSHDHRCSDSVQIQCRSEDLRPNRSVATNQSSVYQCNDINRLFLSADTYLHRGKSIL